MATLQNSQALAMDHHLVLLLTNSTRSAESGCEPIFKAAALLNSISFTDGSTERGVHKAREWDRRDADEKVSEVGRCVKDTEGSSGKARIPWRSKSFGMACNSTRSTAANLAARSASINATIANTRLECSSVSNRVRSWLHKNRRSSL